MCSLKTTADQNRQKKKERDKMKYRLAVFDLDGTILDTLEDLAASTHYALAVKGLPERSIDEGRRFVGNGIRSLIERAVPEGTDSELTDRVFGEFREYYGVHCFDKTRPYEGMIECMENIRRDGMQVAVVSNKADFAVQELCERFFPGLSDISVGEREGVRRKPWPDSVMYVLDSLEVKKEDAVYIGDSEVDIKTAENAGLDEIAVEWGFRDSGYLIAQGAKALAKTPAELYTMLKQEGIC